MRLRFHSVLALAMLAGPLYAQQQQNNVLTGTPALACEAVLCLSSGVRPAACAASLAHYFGIRHKDWRDTERARQNFLSLCPKVTQDQVQRVIQQNPSNDPPSKLE